MSAARQRRLLYAGQVSAAELRDAAVAVIERLDPVVHALAMPLLDAPVGDGVPMLVKDAGQEIAGTPHWVGVAALRDANARSSQTTALVERFVRSGYSILGKTACPTLSAAVTTEPAGFAPTRNPWDLTASAGGSSGGAAVAVATGMVALAHGSDATGSLRCPAALCGVATLNPSAGRVEGVPPAGQPPSDVWRDFVIARHAEDLVLAFEDLTGAHVTGPPVGRAPAGPWRVGLLDHDPELGMAVHPECAGAARSAAALLAALGHHVEEAWPAPLASLWARCGAPVSVLTDHARHASVTWVGDRLGRPVAAGELDADVLAAARRGERLRPEDVDAARAAIASAVAPLCEWWDTYDVLVTPSTFQPAWPLGGRPGPREMGTLLAPFSLSGQPALSLPLHVSAAGQPVGVQLVARRGADELLLRLALVLQQAANWTRRRPPLLL